MFVTASIMATASANGDARAGEREPDRERRA